MNEILEKALADLAEHPDSSARQIGERIGVGDRQVFRALDNAAYEGKCQRWRDGRNIWFWEIPS